MIKNKILIFDFIEKWESFNVLGGYNTFIRPYSSF